MTYGIAPSDNIFSAGLVAPTRCWRSILFLLLSTQSVYFVLSSVSKWFRSKEIEGTGKDPINIH